MPPPPHDPTASPSLWRICDAAGNRLLEALRVLEDFTRFGQNDRFLTDQLKSLRHAVAQTISQTDTTTRLKARETQHDVGVDLQLEEPDRLRSVESLVTGNFRRAQEALRTLEEIAPLIMPTATRTFQVARYELYTLERAVGRAWSGRRRLQSAQIYALVDAPGTEAEFLASVTDLVQAGVDMIQLRAKSLSDRMLLSRAQTLVRATRASQTLAIVNDRPDVAAAAGADGVHLGQDELPVFAARQLLGPHAMIGVSTHTPQQAADAVLAGADYLGVGPTFASTTKRFDHYPGLELLRVVSAQHRLPAFAIGGIQASNVQQIAACGCHRVAVQSALAGESNVAEIVVQLREGLGPLTTAADA